MNITKSCHTVCLIMILMLTLAPGGWAQAPDEKGPAPQAKGEAPAETGEAAEDAYDKPIKPGPNPMNVATDILILRPVGLVMIPVTAIIYVIGYPFAAASGTQEETYQSLVGDTIDYTFERPLGEGAPFD